MVAPGHYFADGTAKVLTTDGHEGKVYEFTGDTALSYADIADAFGQVTAARSSTSR